MSNILGIFNIGKLALFANQRALAVTSQNIANLNTPGYSRQEAVLQSTSPANDLPGQIGTGVQVTEIRRVFDQFIQTQLTSEQSTLGRLDVEKGALAQVEAVFNDAQGTGVSQSLSQFFSALHDLANNPQGIAERTALLEQTRSLISQFSTANNQLQQIRKDLNGEIQGVIGEVNSLATQIANLNGQIRQAEVSGQNANDLRDQRDGLLKDLSEKIDIHTIDGEFGQVNVTVGQGTPLVESKAYTLQGVANADNSGFVKVALDLGTGSTTDITSSIGNGQLKGLIDLRDNLIPGYSDRLDRLAATIVNEVNQQHQAGYGLDGSTGNNFFSPLAPTVTGLSRNTGSGAIGATVNNPTLLTFDPYRLSFAGGNYTIQNLTTGASSTAAYVNPTTITFEGLQINMAGAPANGDTFEISAHQGVAGSMALATTDPRKIAAASSAGGVPGDNSNALLLAQLQEKGVTALGGSTFNDFYGQTVGQIGSDSQAAQHSLTAEKVINENLTQQRGEVSGVSLDEETTNLIKFQRAFEASARLITVADQLLQTILDMKTT
ncbi:MAG: flagellar hook-associated protein FlgK [Nitrospirae bacterium]|nr:flagellar hook-associated protein FlgK [Candidatus Manganitrophaceae bacterium]